MKKSTDVFNSRYVQGGDTEQFANRLGWWDRRTFNKSITDIKVTINERTHKRPWILAYELYGNEQLEWVILQYNNIIDVNEEFIIGKELTLPTMQRLKLELFGKSTGGK